jgi:predicted TIM-barrel fold metal-dependent hydrolase
VIKEMKQALSTRGFRGIKIHVGECTLAEYVVDPVLKLAGECGVPCLIDCGGKYDAAKRMAGAFPETSLIFAHLGRYLCKDQNLIESFIGLAESCRNVFLDVSGVVLVKMIEVAVGRIGSSRLIWGSDGPDKKPDTVSFARTELDKIRQSSLSDKDKNNILSQTILRLLRL